MRIAVVIENFRENITRKLLRLACKTNPGWPTLYQADEYKIEFGWKQPKSDTDFNNTTRGDAHVSR